MATDEAGSDAGAAVAQADLLRALQGMRGEVSAPKVQGTAWLQADAPAPYRFFSAWPVLLLPRDAGYGLPMC